MRRWAWLPIVLVLAGCGSSPSPIGPSAPPAAAPVLVTLCPTTLAGALGFDLGFYQELACNAFQGPSQAMRAWTVAPKLYLRTVDDAGAPIDAVTLDTVQGAMAGIAASFTGGKFGLASIERGTEMRDGVSGYVTVHWLPGTPACGSSDVAKDGGVIDFYPENTACGCEGSRIRPRTAKHELGHAFGYFHTDAPSDLMSGAGVAGCDQALSAREQQAMAYHYR